jgi:short-subunit dehydrogenase
MPTFQNHAVLITGASDGIGRELALQLAAEGARLALVSRSLERLREVAEQCRQLGAEEAHAIAGDVGEREGCQDLVKHAVCSMGKLDMLINNAGIGMFARFSALHDSASAERVIRVNFLGAMHCTYYALPYLRRSRGRVVAVSSVAGKITLPGGACYAASKHAMRAFFSSLRIELADEGVSVTVAYPGFVRTNIYQRFADASGQPGPDRSSMVPSWIMMSVPRCARLILQGARRRRSSVVMPLTARLAIWMETLAPWLMAWLMNRPVRQELPVPPLL